jgi:hypothetical protein
VELWDRHGVGGINPQARVNNPIMAKARSEKKRSRTRLKTRPQLGLLTRGGTREQIAIAPISFESGNPRTLSPLFQNLVPKWQHPSKGR